MFIVYLEAYLHFAAELTTLFFEQRTSPVPYNQESHLLFVTICEEDLVYLK